MGWKYKPGQDRLLETVGSSGRFQTLWSCRVQKIVLVLLAEWKQKHRSASSYVWALLESDVGGCWVLEKSLKNRWEPQV